jgi:hypothetical protein
MPKVQQSLEQQFDLFNPYPQSEIEIWKDIPGYEGRYQASTFGRIKSLARITNNQHCKTDSILKQSYSNGYMVVTLHKPSIKVNKSVHRIILDTFEDNPDNKPEVNHKDGIKYNNKLSNLEWATSQENMIHAYKTGLANVGQGETSHNHKLTEKQVLEIRSKYIPYKYTARMLAKEYGIGWKYIDEIVNKRSWKHIA